MGVAVFAAALFAVWSFAPRLGLIGDQVTTETRQARESARERVDQMTEDFVDDVSDKVGIEINMPTKDITAAGTIDGWSLPLASIDADRAARPHHDYPAWDYGTAVGTTVYAMTAGTITTALDDDGARCGGTVSITTEDGAQLTHCHLSAVDVQRGDRVNPGDVLGESGGQPGAPGAGNTSGPHLHLQIRVNGTLVCPQAQLLALAGGSALDADDLPIDDCFYSTSGLGSFETIADESDPFFSWDDLRSE